MIFVPYIEGRTHPRGAVVLIVLGALLGLLALASPDHARAAREESADLTFIKLEETRTIAGRDVVCEWYTVGKHDVLWKIFRKRSQVDLGGFHRWSREVRKLNPHIADLNLIYPGQKILVPVRDAAPGEPGPAFGSAHRVVKGDTIVGILRRMGIPYRVIYNEYLQMIKALNPEIKNLDLIFPGQVVRVPAFEQKLAAEPSTIAASRAREEAEKRLRAAAAARARAGAPEREAPTPPQVVDRGALEQAREDLPVVEEWRRELARMVGEVAERLGGRYTDEGQHYIPLYRQGQVTLNARLFPLIEFERKARVILDLKGRLPKDLVKTLSGKYRRYQIITVGARETPRSILNKVLPLLGRPVNSSAQNPYTISRAVGVEAVADWVLELEEIPGKGRRAALISLTELPEEVTDQNLASYLDIQGVNVVDVLGVEGSKSYRVFSGRDIVADPSPEVVVMDPSSPAGVAGALLKTLDVAHESGKSLVLKSGEDAGFSITVETEIVFEKAGTKCLVDYGRLSPSLVKLLKENGYSLLHLPPDVEPQENIKEILRFLGYDFKHLVKLSSGSKPDGRGLTVTVSGMLFHKEGTTAWLMTFLKPYPDLSAFLKSHNLKPIFIKLAPKK